VGKDENKHLWLEKWQFLSDICGNFTFRSILIAVEYTTQRHCSKHKTNCKCVTLHTNTKIYRTTWGMPSRAIVSAQKHYCRLCNSQCKNTSISCASVNTGTLMSAVQQSVSARTLLSGVQQSAQEHFHQLCKC
jgi:hypothetical protein